MDEELYKKIVDKLSKEIDYIVVGGMAWEKFVAPSGTEDVDVVATTKEYKKVIKTIPPILEEEGLFVRAEEDPIMSLFTVSNTRNEIELEVINSTYFSKDKKDFFKYVKKYRSKVVNGVRYAKPEIVWYMRLVIPDWRSYIYKCLRDLSTAYETKHGFKLEKLLDDIIEVSEYFNNKKKIKERMNVLKDTVHELVETTQKTQ